MNSFAIAHLIGVLLLVGACNSAPGPTGAFDGTCVPQTRDELMAHVDAPVMILGKALRERDYKDQRPNILIGDGTRVEVDLERWPDRLRGHRVAATGILRRRTPPGGLAQSRAPEWFVIERAEVGRAR